jgi:nuclease-like protein
MDPLIVRHWTRAGEDRLYVKTAGGYDVGYLDRRSGDRVLDDEAWCDAFDLAVATFEVMLRPLEELCEPPWSDLALNLPTRCVRAHAHEGSTVAAARRPRRALPDERTWPLAAGAELAIAAQLSNLDASWRILHGVPAGDGTIDHLVIGPAGVFTVNAKDRPDPAVSVGDDVFILNGSRVRSVPVNRYEARRVNRILSDKVGFAVPVTGVIAVVGASSLTARTQPHDGSVVVVAHRAIDSWLTAQPAVLDEVQVEALYTTARRSTTWVETPPAS